MRLHKIINLGMFSELHVTDFYLPCLLCTIFLTFLVDNKVQLRNCLDIYKAQGQLYLSSVVSVVFLLIGVEKKTWLINRK